MTIIAHRGLPGLLPEHTLAGLSLAHSQKPHYIEADVVLTKDHELIVLHDIYLDTTTNVSEVFPQRARKNSRYYAIDFTLAEIQSLQIKERFKPESGDKVFPDRYPRGETGLRIPSYDQFITMLNHLNEKQDKNIGLYVEIKKPEFHLEEEMDITQELVNTHDNLLKQNSKTIIQCFWPETLIRLKEEFKRREPLIQLIAENSWNESSANYKEMLSQKGLEKISSYADGVGPWLKKLSPKLVNEAQEQGLLVHAYTHRIENDKKDFDEFIDEMSELGIDGLFTDHVDLFHTDKK